MERGNHYLRSVSGWERYNVGKVLAVVHLYHLSEVQWCVRYAHFLPKEII